MVALVVDIVTRQTSEQVVVVVSPDY